MQKPSRNMNHGTRILSSDGVGLTCHCTLEAKLISGYAFFGQPG